MKNSQKGFIVPFLIAIIVVLILGGGIYIYKNSFTEKSDDNTIQNTSDQSSNDKINSTTSDLNLSSTTPVTEKSDKKQDNSVLSNYVDEESGFSFEYPTDLSGKKYDGAIGLPIVTKSNLVGKYLKVFTFAGNDCTDLYSKVVYEGYYPSSSGERGGWYVQKDGSSEAFKRDVDYVTYSKPLGVNRGCVTLELVLNTVGGIDDNFKDEVAVMDQIAESFKIQDLSQKTIVPTINFVYPSGDLTVRTNSGFLVKWVSKGIQPAATQADTSMVKIVLRSSDYKTSCSLKKVPTLAGESTIILDELDKSSACITDGKFSGILPGKYKIELSGYLNSKSTYPEMFDVASGSLFVTQE